MSQQRQSIVVSSPKSAIMPFAPIAGLRTTGCLFHRCSRLKHGILSANASSPQGLRKLKGEGGNDIIEYAFIFMIFMSMLLGIVDFSRVLYTYHFLSNEAREATRWAAVNGADCGPQTSTNPSGDNSCDGVGGMNNGTASGSDILAYVQNHTPPGIDRTKINVTATWTVGLNGPTTCTTTPQAPGCTVEVQVSYPFTFIVPFIRSTPLTLSSTSEMIIIH